MMDSHQSYTADGNHVATKTDARGKVVTYETDLAKDTLTKVTDPNGQSVNYSYDSRRRVTSTSATADGKTYKNTYTYNNDRLKTVSHNTTSDTPDVTYTFDYDRFGNPTTVKVGTQMLSTNVYTTTGDHTLMRVEYGNGGKVHYTRDEFRRVTGIHYDDATTPRFTYGYGANGQVAYVRDNELNRTVWTEYDTSERPIRTHILESANSSSIGTPKYVNTVRYDAYGNVDSYKETVNNSANFETTYAYDVENRPTQLRYGADNRKVNYTYDPIGRLATRTLTGTAPYATTYQYVAPDNTDGITTTLLVKSITQPGHSFSYTYDNVGNITREVYNGKNTTYIYDSLGQLIRYNDERAGKSWVFTYDRGGNLTKEQRYAYTEGTLGTVEYYQDFQYGNANWKDQMTRRVHGGRYNYDMTYDAIGNLTSYAGWTYTWAQGRRLVKQVQDSRTVEYTYDASGLRVRKKFKSTINDYTWAGGKLVHLKAGSQNMHFFYDAEGMPAMVLYNQTPYRYVRNLQEDIIAIVDTSGTTVVEYKYDPWGKNESVTGTLAASVGRYNPFRYRGYIFDEETLMYYLKDRYYYPELRRFINADRVGERNLFLYCRNSPVFRVDNDGNKSSACNFEQFQGKFGDKISHVINQDRKDGRMPVVHFIALLQQMVSEKWKYSHNTAYGAVDCVGIYRYTMNWYYNKSSYKFMKVFTNVENTYRQSVYNSTMEKRNVLGKGKLTEDTTLVKGMALFRNPLGKDGHVAYYVGDQIEGYKDAVVEAVLDGVVVRELSESEEINGEFTHYGYLKGLDYTD